MARTTIPTASITSPVGPYPTLPVTALALDDVWQAADVGNGNQFALGQGKYQIRFRNVHATTPYTVTFTSAADAHRRTGDITTYALAAGKSGRFLVDQQEGWKQTDGMFYLAGSNASVEFCIDRLP